MVNEEVFLCYQCVTAGWGTAGRGGPGAAAWGFPGSQHQSNASEDGRGESWRGETKKWITTRKQN